MVHTSPSGVRPVGGVAEPPRIDGVCGGRGCDCHLTRAAAIEFWGQEEIPSFVGRHFQFPRKAKTLALKIKPPDLEMLKLIPKERERERDTKGPSTSLWGIRLQLPVATSDLCPQVCSSGPYIPINLIQSQQQCRPQAPSRRPVSKTEPVLPKGWGCLIRCTEFFSQGCVVPAVAPCCMDLDVIALDMASFLQGGQVLHP